MRLSSEMRYSFVCRLDRGLPSSMSSVGKKRMFTYVCRVECHLRHGSTTYSFWFHIRRVRRDASTIYLYPLIETHYLFSCMPVKQDALCLVMPIYPPSEPRCTVLFACLCRVKRISVNNLMCLLRETVHIYLSIYVCMSLRCSSEDVAVHRLSKELSHGDMISVYLLGCSVSTRVVHDFHTATSINRLIGTHK